MFDLGWAELAIIAAVALLVIGPKELPQVMRLIGRWMGKARRLASDFQRHIDDMMRETELDEVKQTINRAKNMDVDGELKKVLDPDDEIGPALKPPEEEEKPKPKRKARSVKTEPKA